MLITAYIGPICMVLGCWQAAAAAAPAHLWGVGIEGRHAHNELVQDDAKRPPVHLRAMACAEQQLRGQVVGGADRAFVLWKRLGWR